MAATTHTLRGHVSMVQEDRFRLVGTSGRAFLFTLAHNASQQAADLERLRKANAEVEVEYRGEPNMASGVAHKVRIRKG